MKISILLVISFIQSFLILNVYSQNENVSKVEIQNEDISISAVKNINLDTGSEGKVLYKGKEVATKEASQRTATIVIAASNASEKAKAGADYVCVGMNDQEMILNAIYSLPEIGGKIQLTEGTFSFSDRLIDLDRPINGLTICGMGASTILKKDGDNGDAVIFPRGSDVLLCDFTVDCNNKNTNGVKCYNVDRINSTVQNIKIINVHSEAYGIYLQNSYSKVLNCTIDGGGYGIYAMKGGLKNCIISNNIVMNSTYGSIRIDSRGSLVTNNLISSSIRDDGNNNVINNYMVTK